jgi:putative intracellular protease/amidase
MKILVAVTSADRLPGGRETGLWLAEFAIPFNALRDCDVTIIVASPKGGATPIDPKSEPAADEAELFAPARAALAATRRLADVTSDGFDAILIPGGHGAMLDLRENADLQRLITELDGRGKIIAALSHGVSALLDAKAADGEPLLKGHKATAFTNVEEHLVGVHDQLPFLLEDELRARTEGFKHALLPLAGHIVHDGNLLTGQNPDSSQALATELVAALSFALPKELEPVGEAQPSLPSASTT